jgi:hypothetical protein
MQIVDHYSRFGTFLPRVQMSRRQNPKESTTPSAKFSGGDPGNGPRRNQPD